jgi:hypothetical protein
MQNFGGCKFKDNCEAERVVAHQTVTKDTDFYEYGI